MPFYQGLSFGTYLGVFLLGIWVSKDHIKALFRLATSPASNSRDENDVLTPREAVYGFAIGLALLALFAYWVGLAWWVIPMFLVLYVVLAVAITRIRAEFSFPVHDLHGMGPHNVLLMGFGSTMLGPRTLSALFLFSWFNRVYTSHPMPFQLEAAKMGEASNVSNRRLMICFVLAVAVGVVVSLWACLDVIYANGAGSAKIFSPLPSYLPAEAFGRLDGALRNPTGTDHVQLAAIAAGLISALGLGMARRTLVFFPLHPLGLAIAPSWAMWFLWMSMLVGSVVKALTLKFGGLKAYRKAIPWFYGAMLGEFVVCGLWTVVGVIFHIRVYSFFE